MCYVRGMMISNGDGTYTGGMYDVVGILHGADDRFYAAYLFERPMPGPIETPPKVVRLETKMHHTAGSDDFEGAVEHARALSEQINVAPENLWIEREQSFEWGGEQGAIFLREPWK